MPLVRASTRTCVILSRRTHVSGQTYKHMKLSFYVMARDEAYEQQEVLQDASARSFLGSHGGRTRTVSLDP